MKGKGKQTMKTRGVAFRVIGKGMTLSLASSRFWVPTMAYFAFLILVWEAGNVLENGFVLSIIQEKEKAKK